VGGALNQDNCEYFGLNYGNSKEVDREGKCYYKRINYNILNDLPPLTSGEGERGGEAGKSK
jgi:hypothetical protein